MLQNLEIAQRARLKPIVEIAAALRIEEDELELYGRYKAKVALSILHRLAARPDGKYIDVTSITPTPLGEGKTTTTVGLAMALNRIGRRAIATIRQPSLGPTFGIKGGAWGGSWAPATAGARRSRPSSSEPPAPWPCSCATPSSRPCSRRSRTPRPSSTPVPSATSRPATARSSPT